jgi:hypothetical protein
MGHHMLKLRILAISALFIAASSPRTSAQSAIEEVLEAWNHHQIVAIAEVHRVVEDKRFLAQLIAHPGFSKVVTDIVIEFGTSRHQATLDRYMNGDDVPLDELRKVWADTTVVNGLWDAPIYAEFLAAVRKSNAALPRARQVRVLACDPPIDWARVSKIADAAGYLDRDGHCTALVEREVIARRRRALLIMGDAHVARRTVAGRTATNTVTGIESKHPGSTFVVLTYFGQFSESPTIEARLNAGSVPALFSESWLGDLLAVPPKAPTRTRVGGGKVVAETVEVTHPPRFREVGDALLYLGPKAALTRSVPEAGRWTAEDLNELDRRHQILFGTPLDRNIPFRE